MTRMLVLTRSFPYLPGEQFVEPEAPHWVRDDLDVVVMPWQASGEPRPLPEGIAVDDCLARVTRGERRAARRRALASPLLWREVAWLVRHRRLTAASVKEVLRAVGGALAYRDALAAWVEEHGAVDVAYGYWWEPWTYGAQLLRGRGIGHVVTRAHGGDLYEQRHASGFLALKRTLGRDLDLLLPVSDAGRRVAVDVYGLDPERVVVSRLGVDLPEVLATTSPEGELHVLSVASVIPVKRLDRLADGVAGLARSHPGLHVVWTHFGDGVLMDDLRARVEATATDGLTVELRGSVPNAEVRRHLAEQPVDVFVNTSESEGVPVSIMEAMAFGVPTLAPAVGGIGEIVPAAGPGGALLGPAPDGHAVATALWDWHERCKDPVERGAARAVVEERYDERRNVTQLVDRLVRLGEH